MIDHRQRSLQTATATQSSSSIASSHSASGVESSNSSSHGRATLRRKILGRSGPWWPTPTRSLSLSITNELRPQRTEASSIRGNVTGRLLHAFFRLYATALFCRLPRFWLTESAALLASLVLAER